MCWPDPADRLTLGTAVIRNRIPTGCREWCERIEVKVISFVVATGLKDYFYFILLDSLALLKFLSIKKLSPVSVVEIVDKIFHT